VSSSLINTQKEESKGASLSLSLNKNNSNSSKMISPKNNPKKSSKPKHLDKFYNICLNLIENILKVSASVNKDIS